MIDKIQDRTYEINRGAFTFLTAFEPREFRKTGIRVTSGIERFTLHFTDRSCTMDYVENGKPFSVNIALDGTRACARLNIEHHTPTEVLLSGAWIAEDTFAVKARWIESTVEKTILFKFAGTEAHMTANLTLGLLGAYKNDDEIADAAMQ